MQTVRGIRGVDKLFILASTCEPVPSTLVIDKMTALAQDKGIECAVVFTKEDLKEIDELVNIYRSSGFDTPGGTGITPCRIHWLLRRTSAAAEERSGVRQGRE